MLDDARYTERNGANGDGPPLGREHEIARLLRTIRDRRVRNVVWMTADVRHCASVHYDPARAVFRAFFGRVSIDAASRAMTVEHWNVAREVLWSTRLDAVT